ncbi:hypothetical protein F2Q69_00042755 [Brassica cretica]|uniref:Uncharacterized protein n=1 Tax=Brassica cretica TaxID=69181 RepID=A0A8S9NWU3_BRACR|nr:hypothetical protein F2Q69_00042755 [Brassica cretica]
MSWGRGRESTKRSRRRLGLGRKSDFEISEKGDRDGDTTRPYQELWIRLRDGFNGDQYGIKRGSGLGCEMGQMGCEGD